MSTTAPYPPSNIRNLRPPRFTLAPVSEFVTAADGTPIALKTYEGSDWSGWPFTITACKKKRTFTLGERLDGAGDIKGVTAKGPGWELSLTIQHDRGMPKLEPLELCSIWIKEGAADANGKELPVLKNVFVSDIGTDEGNDAMAMYNLTLRYVEGLCDETSLVWAKNDQLGRVQESNMDVLRIAASAEYPGTLPLSVVYTFSAVAATDVITLAGAAPSNGARFKVISLSSGAAGLTVGNYYYLRASSGSTCKAATTNADGTIVNLSADITGTIAFE